MDDENSTKGPELDLFGNLVLPLRDRRGRPSFKKTPENQQFVALRAAAGWTQEAISEDMGIDPKTLRKNFSRELQSGALMVEGQILDVLSQRARQGHVSSVKALADIIEKGQRRKASRQFVDRDLEEEAAAEPVGKKEAARDAARRAAEDESDPLWGSDLKPGYEH